MSAVVSGLKASDLDKDATRDSPYKAFSWDLQARIIDLGNELPAANRYMQIAAGYVVQRLMKLAASCFKLFFVSFLFHNFDIIIVLITFKTSQEFS